MTELAHIDTPAPTAASSVKDPVCGMTVDPAKSPHHAELGGAAFHFCSAGCLGKFKADPDHYMKPKPTEAAPAGTIYTCPMHPQIRRNAPGPCPICGMALEPLTITADSGPA
jgi:Cu+-exporting ATPase